MGNEITDEEILKEFARERFVPVPWEEYERKDGVQRAIERAAIRLYRKAQEEERKKQQTRKVMDKVGLHFLIARCYNCGNDLQVGFACKEATERESAAEQRGYKKAKDELFNANVSYNSPEKAYEKGKAEGVASYFKDTFYTADYIDNRARIMAMNTIEEWKVRPETTKEYFYKQVGKETDGIREAIAASKKGNKNAP